MRILRAAHHTAVGRSTAVPWRRADETQEQRRSRSVDVRRVFLFFFCRGEGACGKQNSGLVKDFVPA